MADRITRESLDVAIDAAQGSHTTRASLDVAIYPQGGGRCTRIWAEVMVARPTAFVGGATPDLDFVF